MPFEPRLTSPAHTLPARIAFALCALAAIAAGCPAAAAFPAQSAAGDKLIRQAGNAYYHVKVAGLKTIQCEALPRWDSMVKQMEPESADRDRILALLKQLHFEVTIGPEGGATVSHRFTGAPPDSEMAARVQKAAGGIEQALNGFFQLWGPFAFGTYFPSPGSAYQLDRVGVQYRLTEKQGSTEAVSFLNPDFEITKIVTKTPQFMVTMRPAFSRGAEGYLLNAVSADIQIGTNQAGMAMTVTYENVLGVTLPASLDAKVNAQGSTSVIQIQFAGYRIGR
jgi:hypothetical protein